MKIQPWIAIEWTSGDGQHWTFSIRDRITFHNGMKVDAEAIKQSIEQTMKQKDCIAWPLKQVHLQQFSGRVEYAQLLHNASEIRMVEGEKKLTMEAGAFDEGRPAGTLTL